MGQDQLLGREDQVAFQIIREDAIVASIFGPHMALKSGARGWAGNLAFPLRTPGNGFGRFARARRDISNGVDKILEGPKGSRLKPRVHRRVPRSQKAVDGTARRRRLEFASGNKKSPGIIAVVKLP